MEHLEQRYTELSQSIEVWQAQSLHLTSQDQIIELFTEINTKSRRFTEADSKQKITDLQAYLKQKLSKTDDKSKKNQQITEAIRQYKSEVKINIISLCDRAINGIETLKNKLHPPGQFSNEIQQILKFITDKIDTHRQNLPAICARLNTINNFTDLNQISSDYAKLDFVFKDTTDYPAYQQIQPQI